MTVGVLMLGLIVGRTLSLSEESIGEAAQRVFAQELCSSLYEQFLPTAVLLEEEPPLFQSQIIEVMPLYGYAQVLTPSMEELAFRELEISLEERVREGDEFSTDSSLSQERGEETTSEDISALLQAENETALRALAEQESAKGGIFVPHTAKQNPIDLEALRDYDTLVQNFYTVDGNTMASSDQLDVDTLMSYDMTVNKASEGPQILIYHTHSQETFADSVPGDESTSIIGVGDRLAQILTEQYGYQVLHHKGKYDVESRDDAYSTALPDIEQVLKENPSIQVVIDLHRDEMPEETRLVMDLDGRPTARFMFFNGLSRTRRTGSISYLVNEYQEENLAFSFQMQLMAESYYPGLARKIYLKGYRYNMHLRPQSLLIELGAQNNTVEEAMNACDPIAHILNMVLSGQQ